MPVPTVPRRTLRLTGPELLRATLTVVGDQDSDPARHAAIPWFAAHAALSALPSDTADAVVLAAEAIATHYAERECLRRSAVEGTAEQGANRLRRSARRMRQMLSMTLGILEQRCRVSAGAEPELPNPASRYDAASPTKSQLGKNKPGNGNPQPAPRCGARTRQGTACRCPAMKNGRCRMHGGRSSGPTIPQGRDCAAEVNTRPGHFGACGRLLRAILCDLMVRARRRRFSLGT